MGASGWVSQQLQDSYHSFISHVSSIEIDELIEKIDQLIFLVQFLSLIKKLFFLMQLFQNFDGIVVFDQLTKATKIAVSMNGLSIVPTVTITNFQKTVMRRRKRLEIRRPK